MKCKNLKQLYINRLIDLNILTKSKYKVNLKTYPIIVPVIDRAIKAYKLIDFSLLYRISNNIYVIYINYK